MQLYLDMDGVLANFDSRWIKIMSEHPSISEERLGRDGMWEVLYEKDPYFFEELEPLKAGLELFELVKSMGPYILTGVPDMWAARQKVKWGRHHFGFTPVIACRSRDKHHFCLPGDILIDDRTKYRHLWEENDGIFIHYKDTNQAYSELLKALS